MAIVPLLFSQLSSLLLIAIIGYGELLDYAWCDQLNTIIDPWSTPEKWTRPIAGLNKEKWGALNTDIHMF